ncbi:hypothetical protein L9Y85_002167 [Klebsiella variicola]|uniref:hypothetical protein n=1 Tax=Klebsiella variicola TaxID=244366 RepID=UPI000D747341|nr:hypothetical protein [Klebsiella variicola]EKU8541788.1 hypothetical protein [Klebsiella variicola]PXK06155.1 hypothetical protein DMR34_14875 [Klebsiella variicola]
MHTPGPRTGSFSSAGEETWQHRLLPQFLPYSRSILRRLSEKISLSVHFYRIKEKLKWFRFILSFN